MTEDRLFKLMRLIEVRDGCTAAHTWRVALYAQAMMEMMDLDDDEVRRLMRAAALHDIGKIDVPREILCKLGELTDEEREIVQQHPITGYDRLKRMGEDDPLLLTLVRSHHERMDGSGYPDGLSGANVPVAARIFAVVDSFDAMTSIRPYRLRTESTSIGRAIAELREGSGTKYCADAVEYFTELVASGALDWIRRNFNDSVNFAMWSEPENVDEIQQMRTRLCSEILVKDV